MKKNIIIVDDDKGILTLLRFVLDKEYNIQVATNGATALQQLDESHTHPDLIISDLNMPYLNGQSFINQLRISGFYRNIPILVLSAKENLAEDLKQMPFTVEGFIQKPFNPADLKKMISTILAG
ncbi:MAG: response regulator [Bacteroidota bacterium]